MFGLGKIHWEWYEAETARQVLADGIVLSKRWREAAAIEGHVALAQVAQALGRPDAADANVAEAARIAADYRGTEADDRFVALHEALLRLRRGEPEAAVRWADARGLATAARAEPLDARPTRGADIILRYELLVYARLLLRQDCADDALALLQRMRPGMEALGHRQKTVETLILLALAAQAQGEGGVAHAALEEALALAEPGAYVRVFVEEGPELANLLREVTGRGRRSRFARRLLAAAAADQVAGAPAGGEAPLFEPLSERELEVLRLLATELPGPEIAAQLHISVSTFRTHVRNIYQKLDVHSRFEAVTRGEALRLL
jgi:LuxR family maltose regulon positive regulatory protein